MLLHGFTGNGRSLSPIAAALADQFETLAPDLPGHGRAGAIAPEGFAATVDQLVATLESTGRHQGCWLGYSMGARLALGCAVRHPGSVAALVLIGGRAGIADAAERAARRQSDEALAGRIEALGMEAFVEEWLSQPLFATLARRGPAFLEAERRARLANDPRGLAASLRALGPAAQPPLFDELPGVRSPVLLVAGALDTRFVEAARELAQRLPRSELCIVPDCGHAVHLEQPQALVQAVREFLHRACDPVPNHYPSSVEETAS